MKLNFCVCKNLFNSLKNFASEGPYVLIKESLESDKTCNMQTDESYIESHRGKKKYMKSLGPQVYSHISLAMLHFGF